MFVLIIRRQDSEFKTGQSVVAYTFLPGLANLKQDCQNSRQAQLLLITCVSQNKSGHDGTGLLSMHSGSKGGKDGLELGTA